MAVDSSSTNAFQVTAYAQRWKRNIRSKEYSYKPFKIPQYYGKCHPTMCLCRQRREVKVQLLPIPNPTLKGRG